MKFFFDNALYIYLIVFIGFFILEQLHRRYAVPNSFKDGGYHRWIKNISFGIVNKLLGPLLLMPIGVWATNINFWLRPEWLEGFKGLCFDVIMLDMFCYWFHRVCHKIPILWRVHQVHHLDEAYDVTTGFRVHILELIIQNIFTALPIILFGISLNSLILYLTFLGLYSFFQHSNFSISQEIERIISYILVTPSLHSVHHQAFIENTDSNYSFIFSCWDRLFGTHNYAKRHATWKMGLDYSKDLTYLKLMLIPFKFKKKQTFSTIPAPGTQSSC